MASSIPIIDIITAAYNEEDNLYRYEKAVRETLFSQASYNFRVTLVDDGSNDSTWEQIVDICSRDSHFQALKLSRNFGAHAAESAALTYSRGDAAVMLAADLQDPPDVILQFLKVWKEGVDIVWGKRRTRDDVFWRKLSSDVFAYLVRRYALPRGSKMTSGGFMLIDKKVVACVCEFQERNRRMVSLVAWTGFKQSIVEYDRFMRTAGTSGWTLQKMLRSSYDTFIGFSEFPAKLMTFTGLAIFLLAVLLTTYLLYNWMVGHPPLGWSSILVALLTLFGLHFFLLGLIGEYLFRIYTESVHRPLYFISDTAGMSEIAHKPLCTSR